MATAQPRLNLNDPALGVIYPPMDGAAYELNGHHFDVTGKYLRSLPGHEPSESAGQPSLMEQVASASPADLAALRKMLGVPAAAEEPEAPQPQTHQLSRPHGGPLPAEGDIGSKGDGGGGSGAMNGAVDLVAWLRGEKQYAFYRIKQAVSEKYPEVVHTNSKTVVAGLVAAGVLPADEVKRA